MFCINHAYVLVFCIWSEDMTFYLELHTFSGVTYPKAIIWVLNCKVLSFKCLQLYTVSFFQPQAPNIKTFLRVDNFNMCCNYCTVNYIHVLEMFFNVRCLCSQVNLSIQKMIWVIKCCLWLQLTKPKRWSYKDVQVVFSSVLNSHRDWSFDDTLIISWKEISFCMIYISWFLKKN